MYCESVFNKVREKFQYPDNIMPFLSEHRQVLADEKPYKGLRVLHNIPMTFESFFKVESLLAGGASVLATTTLFFPEPKKIVLDLLDEAKIPFELQHEAISGEFDFHLDCGAEIFSSTLSAPKIGASELTQSGTIIYQEAKDLDFPVISVDDSPLKKLEAFGTGIAFVQAFEKLTNESLDNKKVMIFGAGKVGQGTIRALEKQTDKLVIVEKDPDLIKRLNSLGYTALSFDDREAILAELKNTFCLVTAAGSTGCISKLFSKDDLDGIYLANLSVTDDFGDAFSESDVLANKGLINFVLDRPTPVHYLDPVFYAHNDCIDLILSGKHKSTYQAFPDALAQDIISKWETLHNEKLDWI